MVINDAASRKKDVTEIPPVFDKYQGYNDIKRKKIKSQPLCSNLLHSHSQALYSICNRPVMKSSPEWERMQQNIEALADCLDAYKNYLTVQKEVQGTIRILDHPVRQVSENCVVEARTKTLYPTQEEYKILDEEIRKSGVLQPLFFDESKHITEPFETNLQRFRFLEKLQLSVPVDMFKYAPGGSHTTVVCLVQVDESRSVNEKLTQTAKMMAAIKPRFPEFHTRTMKRNFKQQLANIASISPSAAEFIYQNLAIDSSVASHPDTQQRLRLIFLGETGLLVDLRKLNAGRPTGTFDVFFEKLGEIIESVSAGDERRHNVTHISEWISLRDLISQAKDKCPADTPIPSKALVRLQFAPRNPYAHTALSFTQKFAVQYKIQRRQLRLAHPDDHYCAAILLYLKHLSVILQKECSLFFCDDKAKVNVGEPGVVLSTGVRGKQTLAPRSSTLSAADHDMHHKGSLTPSVYLHCDIPPDPKKSFVRGQITTVINDAVFQTSNPFRHAAVMTKLLKDNTHHVLLKFSDGGTDQRNTLEAVKCSLICIFKELDLDLLIAGKYHR